MVVEGASGRGVGSASRLRGLLNRRTLAIGIAVGTAIVLVGSLALLGAGWAPLVHWTCDRQTIVAKGSDVMVPAVLVNSPYLGSAYGQGIGPSSFPGLWGDSAPSLRIGYAVNMSGGVAGGAFFLVNVSVVRVVDTIAFGPGPNTRCGSPLQVSLSPSGRTALIPAPIATASNQSDGQEGTFLENPPAPSSGPVKTYFNNSFWESNHAPISTCGEPNGTSVSIHRAGFTVGFNATWEGENLRVPFTIPFDLNYTYHFPGNGGIWQVDDLSAMGGPGGGWAFSYQPCP